LSCRLKRLRVTVNADYARVTGRFENSLAVPTQAERAINEKPSAMSAEQFY
jgi:hypothetical protein